MRLFPDPASRDEIRFLFFKGIPYNKRIAVIICLLVLGFLVQLLFSFWPGLVLLGLATSMSLVKGYDLTPEAMDKSEKWGQVTPDEYARIKARQKDLKRWDLDALDITNLFGCSVFIVSALLALVIWLVLLAQPGHVGAFWALDCIVLLAPHWFTGVKRYLRQNRLLIKINLLEKIMADISAASDIQVLPMLATRVTREDKRFPTDARLMLRMVGAPASFLGIQVQISINSVQGADYPYLYCVLLSRGKAGCFTRARDILKGMPEFRKTVLTIEPSNEDGVDVLVIRQTTTKTSGYHTKPNHALFIVNFAVNAARRLCSAGSAADGEG